MKILRSTIRKIFKLFGYDIIRINYINPQIDLSSFRKIANAYYKGHKFQCYLGDYFSDCILTGKGWDTQLESIMDKLEGKIRQGDIIEIGANVGASFVPIANKYPSFNFHCVEPVPSFFNLLQKNIVSYKTNNIRSYNLAVSSINGKMVEIHTQMGTAGALAEYDGHHYMGTLKIVSKTVDTLFSDKNVVFIKLDVDGFEFDILKGSHKIFELYKPMCFMEFHTKIMKQLDIDPLEVSKFFEDLGYERISIYYDFKHIITTNSYEELLKIAESVPHYVDVLFEKN